MEIKKAQFVISNTDITKCPKPVLPEYAFIGRSNVGKSSLINMLCNNKKLAKVSSTPGKTTLINHFIINEGLADLEPWYLVDLPGYGYAKRSISQRKEWEKMIQKYLLERPNLMTVFVLIDVRIEPQKIDLEFLNQLNLWHIPVAIIFTKADKCKQSESAKNMNAFINELKKTWQYVPAKFLTSSEKGVGKKQVLEYIDLLNQDFNEQ